ncbi:FG-GAP-like repeat-containing protein [Danxiaibacter flavus]|uniref:FG-GAP-like repeat-containing protein n=1 Tax=Danxiaibacter flavus TaxID=3049108 RepID=A0ABV3ZNV8_9BACT|nr:FG-GAP-like repeat-containing protein [Chitinophagaceae bacterium DXS]
MKDAHFINAHTGKLFNCFYQQFLSFKTKLVKYAALLLTGLICQQVYAQPVITSFAPLSGLPGSTVTIYGRGFSSTPSENIVFIGGTRAYVKTASADKLTVQVPRGITNKPISVMVNNLIGFSATSYITTSKTAGVIMPGTFETPKNFYMNTRANAEEIFSIDDLDGDGKPDIFAIGRFSTFDDFYAAYRNTSTPGNISFSVPTISDIPFSYNRNLMPLTDLNGDGKKDIIVWADDHFAILLNTSSNGSISFNDELLIPLDFNSQIYAVGATDLNADGKPDLYGFRSYPNTDSLIFSQNTSSGNEISFANPIVLPLQVSYHPFFIDLNGDQKADILYTMQDAMAVRINTSHNGITSFDEPENIFPTSSGTFLAVADINKDGKPDIAVSALSNKNDSLRFLLNTSTSGNISFAAPVSFPIGINAKDARLVDIDGNGQLDIAGYEGASRNYDIVRNSSTATRMSFVPPVRFPFIRSGGIEYADFDGDGRQDMAFAVKDYLSFVSVLRNQMDTARGRPSITSFYPTAAMPSDTITIEGDNFNGTTIIRLGGTAVESFKVVSNNRITAVVGRGSTGDLELLNRVGWVIKPTFTLITDTTIKLLSTVTGVVCSGKVVRVKAVVTNAYSGITYRWYRNEKLEPASNQIYTSHSIQDGDSLYCLVSFAGLLDKVLKSEVLKFDVNLSQTPKLHIRSSKGTLICKGTPVIFKAIVNNGDFKPVYQWAKNEIIVGDTSDTYVDSNLQNGDVIRCSIVKAQQCTVLPATASLQMTVDESRPHTPVSIIGPDEVSPSQSNVIFSVAQVPEVRSYKWQIPSGASFVSGIGTNSIRLTGVV